MLRKTADKPAQKVGCDSQGDKPMGTLDEPVHNGFLEKQTCRRKDRLHANTSTRRMNSQGRAS